MVNALDHLIAAFAENPSDASLLALQTSFMAQKLHVPIAQPVRELQPSVHDLAVICVRTEAGAGAVPAFTTVEHLLKWKPQGCLYVFLTGRSLIEMARDMVAISEILVNPNDTPSGRIPRMDFEKMLELNPITERE
jgi:hypothetical protein